MLPIPTIPKDEELVTKSLFKNINISKYKKYYFVFAVLISLKLPAQIFIKDSADFHATTEAIVYGVTDLQDKTKIYITEGTTISNPKMLSNSEITIISSEKSIKKSFAANNPTKKTSYKKRIPQRKTIESSFPTLSFKGTLHDTFFHQLQEKTSFFTNNRENRIYFPANSYTFLLNLSTHTPAKTPLIYKYSFYDSVSNKKITIRPPPTTNC